MNPMNATGKIITGILAFLSMLTVQAAAPLWTFSPLTETQFSLGVNDAAVTVQYTITNQSKKTHTLRMTAIPGVLQNTNPGHCSNPFTLASQQSCTLTLQVQGNLLMGDIIGGPIVCQQGNQLQCYQPSQANSLLIHFIQESPIPHYTITPSAGSNGSINPNTPQVVTLGSSVSFTATAASGYGVNQWLLDGNAVQTGGNSYQLNNIMANHTLRATFSQSTLSPSLSFLALSVNNTALNPALTGHPRSISIHNTGSQQAVNLQVSATGLPTGTLMDASSCSDTLNPGDYCTITLTPGSTASADLSNQPCTSGSAPVPGIITLSSGNTPSTPIEVVVLGYGCIHQAGYVFAIDDTTPANASIGGTVVSTVDQIIGPSSGPGLIWSSNGLSGTSPDVSFDSIYGIGETSTPSAPFPNSGQISGQTACDGKMDGACNSNNIIVFYSPPQTNPAVNFSYYAAGVCRAYTGGSYTDWYLPAICQMGPNISQPWEQPPGCALGTQNIINSLPFLIGRACTGIHCFLGPYSSSTEDSGNTQVAAWIATMPANQQARSVKGDPKGIRCTRTFIA